jgi:DNA gyrase subunit A
MARRGSSTPPPADFEENIVDVDVSEEMRGSYLEYAYSVIYQRALPDARDGMKPVQRRILYSMNEMGLRPDRGHVKCARVVGDVMGKLHPHGDASIYDAMVRLAQPWSMRHQLVDGHGNFGSLGGDDSPAAMRYTESRLSREAMLMVTGIDEETVDFRPNYDGQELEPEVLPAAFPNLLVNGASGIAVGMATNMAPHNLGEVIAAARHLLGHPDATLEDLMRFVPGPDLPTGGKIVGLEGIRDAYESGRGTFRTRATTHIENITPRRKGIVVTELPYGVGPERVVTKIKDLVQAKKLQGIADLKDLTDRTVGLNLVIEIKNGFHPEAVLEELYRLTPMEETFGINNVALVDGQPRTLGLRQLLQVYVDHRIEVVRRRSLYRRRRREERLHLVAGLMIALLNIDEVIQIIRQSDDSAQAKQRLMQIFELSEIQAQYILDTPLRRLTRFDRLELEKEKAQLEKEIAELTAILDSETKLRGVVSAELAAVAKEYANPRRTVLLESSGQAKTAAVPLEVADEPCLVLLSSTGLLARTGSVEPLPAEGDRSAHDVLVSVVRATARGEVGAVTSAGRMLRVNVIDLPALPPSATPPSLAGGAPISEYVSLEHGETIVGLGSLVPDDGAGLVLGTAQGVVKRVLPDYPANRDEFEVIGLKDDDRVVGAVQLDSEDQDLVFIASDSQLLRFEASAVRPQGRPAGGMAGIRLSDGAHVIWFGALDPARDSVVITVSGSSAVLEGTQTGAGKVALYSEYPAKGRATGGVRSHRFLKGEDTLLLAWAGPMPARAASLTGKPVALPTSIGRRDGSGEPLPAPIAAVGGSLGSGAPQGENR